jgi:hypothetical protein
LFLRLCKIEIHASGLFFLLVDVFLSLLIQGLGQRLCPAILGQASETTLQVIPAKEPESRAKPIFLFLCLIL